MDFFRGVFFEKWKGSGYFVWGRWGDQQMGWGKGFGLVERGVGKSLPLLCGFCSFWIIIQYQMSKSGKKIKQTPKEVQSCPICMMRPINCKTEECAHEFCYRCLSKWGRRKGNCPLCRTNFRKIHYKKKIIEPEYLKIFDDDSSVQQSPEVQGQRRPPPPPPLFFRNFAFFMPLLPEFQLSYYPPVTYVMFPNNNA